VKGFLDYLNKGARFIDAFESKDAATPIFKNNVNHSLGDVAVEQMFKLAQNEKGRRVFNVVTSYIQSASQLTIYYSPETAESSAALIFHEALHGFGSFKNSGKPGNLSAADFLDLFGYDRKGTDTDKITQFIEEHCGGYFNENK
jgi:hypothetical protein